MQFTTQVQPLLDSLSVVTRALASRPARPILDGVLIDAAGSTVAEYLSSAGFTTERVVVELNEEIVPRGRYADTVLRDGDRVEIVCFMGGG